LVGKHLSQAAFSRPDPTELYIYDPHAEQILAQSDAPLAQTTGFRIARFQFDRCLIQHDDVLM
jgi:hypothetical protein